MSENHWESAGAETGEDLDPQEIIFDTPAIAVEGSIRPVETRFILTPVEMNRRVVLGDLPEIPNQLTASLQQALKSIAQVMPMRAARLQDLYGRMVAARRRFLEVQEREDALRRNENLHAVRHNETKQEELTSRRKDWENRRAMLTELVRELESELRQVEAPYLGQLTSIEDAIAQARAEIAHEREHQLEAARSELIAAEDTAALAYAPRIQAAREAAEARRTELAIALQRDGDAISVAAQELAAKRWDEARQLSPGIERAEEEALRQRAQSEQALTELRKQLIEASARAGLLPGDEAKDFHSILVDRISHHGVSDECPGVARGEGMDRPEHPWWHTAFEYLALVTCGSIFGFSLGIVTGFQRGARITGLTFVLCALGIFAFWLIGQVIHRASALAAETFHAGGNDLAALRSGFLWKAATAFGLGITAMLVAIEIVVERFGIVTVATSRIRGMEDQAPNEWAFVLLAAVVVVPFAAFHGYAGLGEVRRRVIRRRIEQQLKQAHSERLQEREVQALAYAVGLWRDAEQTLAAVPIGDAAPGVQLARRRLEEALQQVRDHPQIRHAEAFTEQCEQQLESNLELRSLDRAVRLAQELPSEDPIVQAKRRRLLALESAPPSSVVIDGMERALEVVNNRLRNDALVESSRIRVRIAQRQLNELEEEKKRETRNLRRLRAPIVLEPDHDAKIRLQDAWDDWLAAQILFDKEYRQIMSYVEAPWGTKWYARWKLAFGQDEVVATTGPSPAAPAPRVRQPLRTALQLTGLAATVTFLIRSFLGR